MEMRVGSLLLIFDLGTGVRQLGARADGPLDAHVFLTHYHYDHLQGLPFFGPIADPKSRFIVRGPTRNGKAVREILSSQMQPPFFPVTAEMVFRAQLEFQPFEAGDRLRLSGVTVTAIEAHHPGGSLAYRVEHRGQAVVYATDHEHGPRDAQLIDFSTGADILIYDAMYTDDEYLGRSGSPKAGWGHSTWQSAVSIALAAKVKTLVLFHHEPTRSDDALDEIIRLVRRRFRSAVAAREGLILRPS